jgi:hypothetical protein
MYVFVQFDIGDYINVFICAETMFLTVNVVKLLYCNLRSKSYKMRNRFIMQLCITPSMRKPS